MTLGPWWAIVVVVQLAPLVCGGHWPPYFATSAIYQTGLRVRTRTQGRGGDLGGMGDRLAATAKVDGRTHVGRTLVDHAHTDSRRGQAKDLFPTREKPFPSCTLVANGIKTRTIPWDLGALTEVSELPCEVEVCVVVVMDAGG